MEKEKFIFFWNGVFSNWHYSVFTIDGVKYNCGEQYMMYQKAITFGDADTAKKILDERLPKEQKALGRTIKNFDAKVWDEVKYELVKKGLREKFNQNVNLKSYLLTHKGFTLVEASPYDRIWGIGFGENNAMENIDKWGENLLGKILTELSNDIINPKEQALYLMMLHFDRIHRDNPIDSFDDIMKIHSPKYYDCKEGALITVESHIYSENNSPFPTMSSWREDNGYWNKVKNELEKI